MGLWFADLLEKSGSEVFCVGRKTALSPAEAARMCDVVVISVPIVHTVEVIREIGPLISEDGLLMDLTSIKKAPMEAMLRYSSSEVVGAHPLFGPDMDADSKLKAVVCPGRGKRGLKWLVAVLEHASLEVTILSPERHDHIMGLVQGVNHFSTLALASCISRSGLKFEDFLNCSTQTFKQRLDRIRDILKQQAELFSSLLIDNPHSREFMDEYLKAAGELMGIAGKKDKKAFDELFEMLRNFFKNEKLS